MAKTLLLADDSVTIQKVVGISLASEDIALVTVDNGDDAIARARELRPDAILADCVMPGRSGYEVCEQIQADPSLRHIPVLLLTGTFEAFDEERAARCGAAGHIAKPFEAQTLVDEVHRLFALAASRRPAPPAAAPPRAAAPGAATAASPAARSGRAAGPPTNPVIPAAAPAPEPEPVAESFDFFEEDLDELLPAELAEDGDLGAGDEVALDSSDSPFAFGRSSQPGLREAPRAPLRAAERTVAILPEQRPARAPAAASRPEPTPLIGEADLASVYGESARRGESAAGRTALMTEGLDFDLGAGDAEAAPLAIGEADLGGATLLEPQGVESFDVSAADLDDPLAVAMPTPRPRAAAPPPAPALATPAEALSLELIEPEPEPPPPPEFPEDRPLLVERPSAGEPARAAEIEVDALARSALDALGPRLRAQLHETLEKVAWESLGEVTDQIVRHAVERVEAIAWEVIPQMAEAMIREEIRRMKDEEPS
jgi:CheY-like chemotaxis protein